jgi:hypothetical protein
MKQYKKDLQAVTKEFKALTKKVGKLTTEVKKTAVGELEYAQSSVKLKSPAQHTVGALKTLTKQTDKLIKAVDKFEKEKAARRKKAKPKKTAAKKPPSKKAKAETATDQVVNIIKRSKKGVDTPTLMKKTGLAEKTVRNVLFRASNQGKIKRAAKGIYVGA